MPPGRNRPAVTAGPQATFDINEKHRNTGTTEQRENWDFLGKRMDV
jgi:hypothetical protein